MMAFAIGYYSTCFGSVRMAMAAVKNRRQIDHIGHSVPPIARAPQVGETNVEARL
jgi:elongation factor P hydroxylase